MRKKGGLPRNMLLFWPTRTINGMVIQTLLYRTPHVTRY